MVSVSGELMEREGVYWDKADNTRSAGKAQLHNRLAFDGWGIPMLYVFSTCKHFIRTIPSLVYSQVNVEDVDTDGEDHIYDECRYVCMENPCAAPMPSVLERSEDDPLDLNGGKDPGYVPYAGRMWR